MKLAEEQALLQLQVLKILFLIFLASISNNAVIFPVDFM
jgi:hypothetical protein